VSELVRTGPAAHAGVTASELLELGGFRQWLGARELKHWLLAEGLAEPNGAPGRLLPTPRTRELGAIVLELGAAFGLQRVCLVQDAEPQTTSMLRLSFTADERFACGCRKRNTAVWKTRSGRPNSGNPVCGSHRAEAERTRRANEKNGRT
jgi:hypothetical protein